MFRSRTLRARPKRERTIEDKSDDDSATNRHDFPSETLVETRQIQALRTKHSGLDHVKLAMGSLQDRPEIKAWGKEHDERDKLWTNFTKKEHGYTNGIVTKTNLKEEDEYVHMLQFIEAELAKKNKKPAGAETPIEKEKNGTIAGLCAIPTYLKGIERPELNSEAQGWLTGIQEVKLPSVFRIHNIEETELAKQQLAENMNVTISQGKDEKQEINHQTKTFSSISNGFGTATSNKQKNMPGATDERVAFLFKKKLLQKRKY